uniref:Uncharacterized protein n=1 Tax=viral metagenome TaxID=1070528 RepID=A0A6H2A5C2_9ZZZZ
MSNVDKMLEDAKKSSTANGTPKRFILNFKANGTYKKAFNKIQILKVKYNIHKLVADFIESLPTK